VALAEALLLLPFVRGLGLGFFLAAPPGPMNALIASESMKGFFHGWRTGFGALTSDMVWAALAWVGALTVFEPTPMRFAVHITGGALMGWFAWGAWKGAEKLRRRSTVDVTPPPEHSVKLHLHGYGRAFALGLTNPYQIGWWLTAGTAFITEFGWAILGGLFVGILLWITTFSASVHWGARRSRTFQLGVAYLSTVGLAAFAVWLEWGAVRLWPEVA
jgi:threonine/homoserine/homoserine lactone efflux protein